MPRQPATPQPPRPGLAEADRHPREPPRPDMPASIDRVFFFGFRRGMPASGLGQFPAGVIGQACRARAASSSPSSSIDFSRISTFRIFPVTVIGNSSVTCT